MKTVERMTRQMRRATARNEIKRKAEVMAATSKTSVKSAVKFLKLFGMPGGG